MIRLLADENFNGKVIQGLRRRQLGIDIVRVRDVGLETAIDPVVLEWAAAEVRVLLTHDVSTMPDFAYGRIGCGAPMPGVVVVSDDLSVGRAVEEIVILVECSTEDELKDRVHYLPL